MLNQTEKLPHNEKLSTPGPILQSLIKLQVILQVRNLDTSCNLRPTCNQWIDTEM